MIIRRQLRCSTRLHDTPGGSRSADERRLQVIRSVLSEVRPPSLAHVELKISLNDTNTAGVRRHLGRYELAVGRELVDAIGDRPEFRAYLAHEMGHLIDRRLNLSIVPCAAAVLAGAAAVLLQTRLLAGPRWLVFATLYAMIGLVIAMTAIMRRSEYRADRAAAELTSLMLVREMLYYIAAQPQPPRWQQFIATHPTTHQRIDRLTHVSMGDAVHREDNKVPSRRGGVPPARPRRRR